VLAVLVLRGAQTLTCDVLTPAARTVAASGELPFPNPMGLPRLDAFEPPTMAE